MTDLELFCQAMDAEWVVERYELEGDQLRVHYRSLAYPTITWSHLPLHFERTPAVGTVGRIGFIGNRALEDRP